MMFKRDDEVGFQLLEKQFEVEENLIECKRLELETEDEFLLTYFTKIIHHIEDIFVKDGYYGLELEKLN